MTKKELEQKLISLGMDQTTRDRILNLSRGAMAHLVELLGIHLKKKPYSIEEIKRRMLAKQHQRLEGRVKQGSYSVTLPTTERAELQIMLFLPDDGDIGARYHYDFTADELVFDEVFDFKAGVNPPGRSEDEYTELLSVVMTKLGGWLCN